MCVSVPRTKASSGLCSGSWLGAALEAWISSASLCSRLGLCSQMWKNTCRIMRVTLSVPSSGSMPCHHGLCVYFLMNVKSEKSTASKVSRIQDE